MQTHHTNPHACHFASPKLSVACGYEDWQLRPSVISQRESEPAVEITLTVRGATGDDCTVLISGHYRFESAEKGGKGSLREHLISSDSAVGAHIAAGQSNEG